MNNEEYLGEYLAWKDKVNSEDVDTPERFAAYLQDRKNAQVLEAIDELVSQRLDELDNVPEYKDLLIELLPVAQLLGLDVEWYRPKKEIEG